jgi:hypothetical protein
MLVVETDMDRYDVGLAFADVAGATSPKPRHLRVVVLHTSPERTRAALRSVAQWTRNLDATVWLVDVHAVPYPVPLDRPTVAREHLQKQLRDAAEGSEILLQVQVLYARDRTEALRQLLVKETVLVVPTRRCWWRTSEERLARALTHGGHKVALVTV